MSAAFDVGAAAEYLRSGIGTVPRIAVVLGSGLGVIEDGMVDPVVVPFADVPGYPSAGVQGHAGRYVSGTLGGVDVLLQCGRFHMYEGHGPEMVAAPVRVAHALGVQVIVFTNASGGVRRTLGPGDIVLLDDHINWMFTSPLFGPVAPGETRFPDMSEPYDPELRALARAVSVEVGERLEEGTYAALLGPQYETAAEVRMLERLGADVVGMSTVPEVLVARACGVRCLAFSVVANKAVGLAPGPLSHEEVVQQGKVGGTRLARVLTRLVPKVAEAL
ncbi:MAG: purine-nucleoside phosphorylase [Gemmatimonadota bacterium]|jgi:purine-nucleoside phosphorylase